MAGRSVGWAVFFAVLDAVLPVECAAGSFVFFGEDDAIVVGSVIDQSVFFGIDTADVAGLVTESSVTFCRTCWLGS